MTDPEKPAALGYRMPAEWEPHAATWLSWPRREGISFPGAFDRVMPTLRQMVESLLASERVCINVCNGAHDAEAMKVLEGLPHERLTNNCNERRVILIALAEVAAAHQRNAQRREVPRAREPKSRLR